MTERVTEESYNPFNLEHRIGENPLTSDDLTPENLDRIAKALQKDLLPDDDYHAQWCREACRHTQATCRSLRGWQRRHHTGQAGRPAAPHVREDDGQRDSQCGPDQA